MPKRKLNSGAIFKLDHFPDPACCIAPLPSPPTKPRRGQRTGLNGGIAARAASAGSSGSAPANSEQRSCGPTICRLCAPPPPPLHLTWSSPCCVVSEFDTLEQQKMSSRFSFSLPAGFFLFLPFLPFLFFSFC